MTDNYSDEIAWKSPLSFHQPQEEKKAYPIDSLPNIIREPVLAYQQYGQQPVPLIACAALANVSLACQTLANVARDHLLVSPSSLYFVVAAASGERKTQADKAFGLGIRQWQTETRQKLMEETEEATVLYQAWCSERDGIIRQMRQASQKNQSISGLKRQLRELLSEEPEFPLLPELYFEDCTQEALSASLSKGWPSSSLWSDEAGIVLSGSGMQSNTTKFVATLNKLWDGNAFTAHRKTAKNFTVSHRRLTLSLMLQPLLLKQLLKRQEGVTRHTGFLARTLITQPVSSMGGRYYQHPPEEIPGLAKFHQQIQKCLTSTLNLDHLGCHNIPTLHFSKAAKATWIEFFNQIENGITSMSEWRSIPDFASKSAENVARLSALFHLFLEREGDITVEAVEQAIAIVRWHLHETKHLFDPSSINDDLKDAQKLLSWIKGKQLNETTSRYLQQFGPVRDKSRRDRATEILIEHHYLAEILKDGKTVFFVNPELLKK